MFRKTSKKNTKKYFLSINTVEFGLYFSIRLLRFSVTWGTDTPGSTSWRQVLYTFFLVLPLSLFSQHVGEDPVHFCYLIPMTLVLFK